MTRPAEWQRWPPMPVSVQCCESIYESLEQAKGLLLKDPDCEELTRKRQR